MGGGADVWIAVRGLVDEHFLGELDGVCAGKGGEETGPFVDGDDGGMEEGSPGSCGVGVASVGVWFEEFFPDVAKAEKVWAKSK